MKTKKRFQLESLIVTIIWLMLLLIIYFVFSNLNFGPFGIFWIFLLLAPTIGYTRAILYVYLKYKQKEMLETSDEKNIREEGKYTWKILFVQLIFVYILSGILYLVPIALNRPESEHWVVLIFPIFFSCIIIPYGYWKIKNNNRPLPISDFVKGLIFFLFLITLISSLLLYTFWYYFVVQKTTWHLVHLYPIGGFLILESLLIFGLYKFLHEYFVEKKKR